MSNRTKAEEIVMKINHLLEERSNLENGCTALTNSYNPRPFHQTRFMWHWSNTEEMSADMCQSFKKFLMFEIATIDKKVNKLRKSLKVDQSQTTPKQEGE